MVAQQNVLLEELEECKLQLNVCTMERKTFENKWKCANDDLKMSFETAAMNQKTIDVSNVYSYTYIHAQ